MTSGYMAVLFNSIDRMAFLPSTLGNADPLFTPVITSPFYLHNVDLADQDQASGRVFTMAGYLLKSSIKRF